MEKKRKLTFNASAAVEQCTDVSLDSAITDELMTDQIRVMGRRYVVFGQRASHVMCYLAALFQEGGVV